MSNWIPEGSVPYGMSTSTYQGSVARHMGRNEGSVPRQAIHHAAQVKKRDPKLCIGNGNTCKGFKTKDSELCVGHRKAVAKMGQVSGGSEDA